MSEKQAQEKWPAECRLAIKELFDEWEEEYKLAEAVAETCAAIRRSPQSVQFDLLFATGIRNGLDAFQVARDLKLNSHLWDGFVFDRCAAGSAITLRDIVSDDWNADTLLILPKNHAHRPAEFEFPAPVFQEKEMDELWELAAGWNPSELEWAEEEEARNMLGTTEQYRLLRVWWD